MRASRIARLAVILSLTGAIVLVASHSALSYPEARHLCDDSSRVWEFDNGYVNWDSNPTKKDRARAAINTLNNPLDYDGTRFVTLPEGGGVPFTLRNEGAGGSNGGSGCIPGFAIVWINNFYAGDASFVYHVTRHEFGHMIGMHHSGQYDSRDDIVPSTMSSCVSRSTFPASNVFEQDGHAYENWLWSSLENEQLHANIGFEHGMKFWGKTGGATTEHTSGGATGPSWVGWHSTGLQDYVYQTVNLPNESVTGREYRAKANAREGNAGNSTWARVELWRQSLDYPYTAPNCDYPNGITQPNGDPAVGPWIKMTDSNLVSIGTSWEAFWTIDPTQWRNPTEEDDGFAFRVRLYGYTYNPNTGNYGDLQIDNVRGESR
jgi:hypothetical protein